MKFILAQPSKSQTKKPSPTLALVQPSSKKPKSNIIDNIFKSTKQSKQKKKQQQQAMKTIQQIQQQKKQKKSKQIQKQLKQQWKIQDKLRKLNNGEIPSAKKVQAGLKIYTEEELNIGKGGDTKLCPIDCQCCF